MIDPKDVEWLENFWANSRISAAAATRLFKITDDDLFEQTFRDTLRRYIPVALADEERRLEEIMDEVG